MLVYSTSATFSARCSPPPAPPTPPPPATAPPPPPPPMQSRPAGERPSRLSLLPLVRDLDEAAAGQPVAAPPSGPKSRMEWDEEETPPRAQEKVRQLFREVFNHHKRRISAAATTLAHGKGREKGLGKAKAEAIQELDGSATSISGYGALDPDLRESRRGGVRNARDGIQQRRQLELSSLRAYDGFMLPLALATQRAPPLRRTDTKSSQQETSWPQKLKAKASAHSLKSKSSLTSLRKSPNSPQSPAKSSPIFGEAPPPVPRIPTRYAMGSPEIDSEDPVGHASISPWLPYEQLVAERKPPTTPTFNKLRKVRTSGSTTTVNTIATTPSSSRIQIPDEDPFWDESVARVREKVRQEQEAEQRERKASDKAERRFIRNVSKGREGHLKWAKLAIEGLVGRYDEHGWLPKKDPKDFDDDDWKFVLEVLDHEDTKALRDRLFKKPEWIEADKARQRKYEEAMRTNPTPEYLAARKAERDKEKREYGYRKILGLLTEEELEHEHIDNSPPVGLGITNDPTALTPQTTHTSKSSEVTGHVSSINQPRSREKQKERLAHGTPSKSEANDTVVARFKRKPLPPASRGFEIPSNLSPESARHVRHSVEQMTGVFETESFNPRLSRLGSEEVKEYIREKSSTCSEPQASTPTRTRGGKPGNRIPHLGSFLAEGTSTPTRIRGDQPRCLTPQLGTFSTGEIASPTHGRGGRRYPTSRSGPFLAEEASTLELHPTPQLGPFLTEGLSNSITSSQSQQSRAVRRSVSENDLLKTRPPSRSPPAPPLDIHPALRGSRVPATPSVTRSAGASRIPRLQRAASSNLQSINQETVLAVKPSSEPTTSPPVLPPPPSFSVGRTRPLHSATKIPSFVRRPSTTVDTSGSASEPATPYDLGLESSTDLSHERKDAQASPARSVHHTRILKEDWERGSDENVLEYKKDSKLRTPPWKAAEDIGKAVELEHSEQLRSTSLPLYQPEPRNLSRLSRIPDMPDASDFLAAMGDEPGVPRDTTSSSLPASATPRDRLTAKRSGIPVASGSNINPDQDHQIVAHDFAAPSPSLPVITIQESTPTNITSPSQPSLPRIATGKWEIIPPTAQQTEQLTIVNEEVAPAHDPALYRIDQVQDLTQFASVTGNPAQQPAVTANASLTSSHARLRIPKTPHNPHIEGRIPTPSPGSRYETMAPTLNTPMVAGPDNRLFPMGNDRTSNAGEADLNKPSIAQDPQMEKRIPTPGFRSFTETAVPIPPPRNAARPADRSFSTGNDRSTSTVEAEISFEDVINAWQQSSPLPSAQSHNSLASFKNQEIQILRSEIGLEPIREHIPGNAKHPNHHYTWNTKKIMCRRKHNPGVVLPSLPSPTPGQPARMAEYATEFFVGSSYTNEPSGPDRCDSCDSFCCKFAELSSAPQQRTTDIIELNQRRRNAEAVANLRSKKPNGVEEWDAFLKCSQCKLKFCPECIMLCAEEMCQEPVCTDCREGTELCRIHNII